MVFRGFRIAALAVLMTGLALNAVTAEELPDARTVWKQLYKTGKRSTIKCFCDHLR